MKYHITTGAFAIVFNGKNEVLLAHKRDFDLWTLPGGGIEKNETQSDAVIREVREETGFTATIVRLVGVYTKPNEDDVIFAFLCTVTGTAIGNTEEINDVRFFDQKKLPESTSFNHREMIRDAVRNFSEPIFKIHTKNPRVTLTTY